MSVKHSRGKSIIDDGIEVRVRSYANYATQPEWGTAIPYSTAYFQAPSIPEPVWRVVEIDKARGFIRVECDTHHATIRPDNPWPQAVNVTSQGTGLAPYVEGLVLAVNGTPIWRSYEVTKMGPKSEDLEPTHNEYGEICP